MMLKYIIFSICIVPTVIYSMEECNKTNFEILIEKHDAKKSFNKILTTSENNTTQTPQQRKSKRIFNRQHTIVHGKNLSNHKKRPLAKL